MRRSTYNPCIRNPLIISATLLLLLAPACCAADPWGSRALDYVLNFLLSGLLAVVLSLVLLLVHALSRRVTTGLRILSIITALIIGCNLYTFAQYVLYGNHYDVHHFLSAAWVVLILVVALYAFAMRIAVKAFLPKAHNNPEH